MRPFFLKKDSIKSSVKDGTRTGRIQYNIVFKKVLLKKLCRDHKSHLMIHLKVKNIFPIFREFNIFPTYMNCHKKIEVLIAID